MVVTPSVALNPSRIDQAKEADLIPSSFRPVAGETGIIRYRLAEPGIVRVYIRPRSRRFLVVRTLVDWQLREAGEHEEVWDGRDSRGNILDPALYCATIQSQPPRGSVAREDLPLDVELHHEDVIIVGNERIHAHTLHEEDKCNQLKVTILEPKWSEKVRGVCRIVSQVSEEARGYGRETGHSARYYVDYLVLHENKTVTGPIAIWEWDTRVIPNGKHILSVAQCDHHDHMASDSIIVELDNP